MHEKEPSPLKNLLDNLYRPCSRSHNRFSLGLRLFPGLSIETLKDPVTPP